jgi:hypothetical protein
MGYATPTSARRCRLNRIIHSTLPLPRHASRPATTDPLGAAAVRVAIVNNGAIKGGSPEVFANLR